MQELRNRLYPIYAATFRWIVDGRTFYGSTHSLDPIPASQGGTAVSRFETPGADEPFTFIEIAHRSQRVPGQQAVLTEDNPVVVDAGLLLKLALFDHRPGFRTVSPREAAARLEAEQAAVPAGA